MKSFRFTLLLALLAAFATYLYALPVLDFRDFARNTSGVLQLNTPLYEVNIKIQDGTTDVYEETFTSAGGNQITSDGFGIFRVNIGTGTPQSGNYSSITMSYNIYVLCRIKINSGDPYRTVARKRVAVVAYEATIGVGNTVETGEITNGTIINDDISATAGIDVSKLAGGSSGDFLVTDPSGTPTWSSFPPSGAINTTAPITGDGTAGNPIGLDYDATLQVSGGQLGLPATGVTFGTYGDGTNVPQITVDAQGRITSAADVAISFPAETDPEVQMTTINAVPVWDGTSLVDGSITDDGLTIDLGALDLNTTGTVYANDGDFTNNVIAGNEFQGNLQYGVSGTGAITGGPFNNSANVTLDLTNTGVTAGTYGDGTNVPQITVDAQGRITSAADVAISFPAETDPVWTAAISGNQTITGNWTFNNTITGDISGNAGTATNIAGGAAGDLPYQIGTNTTSFLGIGTANSVMTSTGSAPQWVTSLTDAQVDNNLTINGGTITNTPINGSIIGGTTAAAGTFTDLTVNGNTTLGDANTDNVVFNADVNSHIIPNTTNTFNLGSDAQRWNALYLNGASLHIGVSGDEGIIGFNTLDNHFTFDKDVEVTGYVIANNFIGDLNGNATTATNIAGGAAGDLPYQTGANTTSFLGIGAANSVMTSTGSAPQWVASLTDAQVDNNLTINGGTINNTPIGGTTAAAGTFTDLTVYGNTTLGDDATADQVTVNATINGDLIPTANDAYDLGEDATPLRWRDIYLSGGVFADGDTYLGDDAADALTVNATSTFNNDVTINGASSASAPALTIENNSIISGAYALSIQNNADLADYLVSINTGSANTSTGALSVEGFSSSRPTAYFANSNDGTAIYVDNSASPTAPGPAIRVEAGTNVWSYYEQDISVDGTTLVDGYTVYYVTGATGNETITLPAGQDGQVIYVYWDNGTYDATFTGVKPDDPSNDLDYTTNDKATLIFVYANGGWKLISVVD